MKRLSSYFRFEDALIPNTLAWIYILAAYTIGFYAIMADAIVYNFVGAVLLAHSMVIAAYFVHECAHDSLFTNSRYNRWFGEMLIFP